MATTSRQAGMIYNLPEPSSHPPVIMRRSLLRIISGSRHERTYILPCWAGQSWVTRDQDKELRPPTIGPGLSGVSHTPSGPDKEELLV